MIPVHIGGAAADMDGILAVAKKHNVPVIEDAAQSFGATYKGRRSCGLSTIGCTSFFPAKPLGCYGDGGACFTNDADLAPIQRFADEDLRFLLAKDVKAVVVACNSATAYALDELKKVNGIPILGVIENMSTHICSSCGHEEPIFGSGGGEQMATDFDVELLGQLPLDATIREQTDSGKPTVVAAPESAAAGAYRSAAQHMAASQATKGRDYSSKFPNIVVEAS